MIERISVRSTNAFHCITIIREAIPHSNQFYKTFAFLRIHPQTHMVLYHLSQLHALITLAGRCSPFIIESRYIRGDRPEVSQGYMYSSIDPLTRRN